MAFVGMIELKQGRRRTLRGGEKRRRAIPKLIIFISAAFKFWMALILVGLYLQN